MFSSAEPAPVHGTQDLDVADGIETKALRNAFAHEFHDHVKSAFGFVCFHEVVIALAVGLLESRHLALVDAVRHGDDPALRRLPEHFREPDNWDGARSNEIGKHLPWSDGRQLIDIADDQEHRMPRHGFHKRMHKRHIDHRRFVDDEKVGIERVVLIFAKSHRLRIDLKQPMDGFRFVPRRLAHALGGASRRRAEEHLDMLRLQDAQDRIHNGGLADAGTSGDDEYLRAERQLDRLFLAFGEREGRFAREPSECLGGIDFWPRRFSGCKPQDALRDPFLGLVKPGEKNALCFFDAVAHNCLFGKLERHGRLDEWRRHFKKFFGERRELVHGKAAMAVV